MVTDDEEFCISSMKALMGQAQVDTLNQVDYCITGLEMLQQVIKAFELGIRYRLILTDFNMPEMGGIEATIKLRTYF